MGGDQTARKHSFLVVVSESLPSTNEKGKKCGGCLPMSEHSKHRPDFVFSFFFGSFFPFFPFFPFPFFGGVSISFSCVGVAGIGLPSRAAHMEALCVPYGPPWMVAPCRDGVMHCTRSIHASEGAASDRGSGVP